MGAIEDFKQLHFHLGVKADALAHSQTQSSWTLKKIHVRKGTALESVQGSTRDASFDHLAHILSKWVVDLSVGLVGN